MSDHIPVGVPMKPKKKRVKHFVPYDSTRHWTNCGVAKREGDIIAYITDLRTSVETHEVIGRHRNWTEDPSEVTCKRCLRSVAIRVFERKSKL